MPKNAAAKPDYLEGLEIKRTEPNVLPLAIRGAGDAKVPVKWDKSDKDKEAESKILKLEKVENFFGCVAGSGSDFFPIYRKGRNKELERLEQMDKDWDNRQSAEAFQASREANMKEDDAATEKRRAKRQRKKDNAERNKQFAKEAEGIKNEFASNGSWLEQMMKMNPEEMKAQIEKDKEGASAGSSQVPVMPKLTARQMDSAQNITMRDDDL